MKKIDYMVLLLIGIFAFALPISLVVMQNNRDNFITAKRVEDGGWSVKEIHVKLGDSIKLSIRSDDVTHSFTIEAYNISVNLYPGETVDVTINAILEGEFIFRCFVYCSPLHSQMVGKLIVTP